MSTKGQGPRVQVIRLFSGFAGNVNNMIGAGIFATPVIIWKETGSAGLSLILWIIGGIISLFGSLSYSALGSRYAESGGETAYLREAYKKPWGLASYLFAFSMVIIIRPAIIIADCNIAAQYLLYTGLSSANSTQSTNSTDYIDHLHPNGYIDNTKFLALRGISLGILWLITFYHVISAKWADRINTVLAVIKSLTVFAVAILGFRQMHYPITNNEESWSNFFNFTQTNAGSIARAMLAILFTYDGWNNLNYSLDEFADSDKLHLSNTLSVIFVSLLYVFVNIAYISAIPTENVFNKDLNYVNEVVGGEFSFIANGRVGGIFLSLTICLSAFGAVAAYVWSGARVIYAAARAKYFPFFSSWLSKWDETTNTPVNALVAQCAFCTIMTIFLPSNDIFLFLVSSQQYSAWIFYTLTGIGLIRLHFNFNHEHENESFQVWKCTVLFVSFGFFILVVSWVAPSTRYKYPYWTPLLFSFLTLIVGAVLWWYRKDKIILDPKPNLNRNSILSNQEELRTEVAQNSFYFIFFFPLQNSIQEQLRSRVIQRV